ncbi:ROK family protein [Cellulomonas palmilytica]|uniref:ROK family protein n=1 Tax=Cellulomonas palmilytica TaxID=2608402 RepID=UPI001F340595|nr:ROK family protein [Cellulomonas palmilytica]UJP38569.1 ROK family protein [Cellulomonas palmilytica]
MTDQTTAGPATGRPPTPARPSARPSVGVDVGGTSTVTVVLDGDGRVGERDTSPTPSGAAAIAAHTAQAVRRTAARAGLALDDLAGVGIGVPGVVDPGPGTVANAVNLGIDGSAPLAALVATALGAAGLGAAGLADDGAPRVVVENDLNAAVLGAAHVLHERTGTAVDDLAFIALGTGLAAGIMLDGRLRRGPHRAAGEIGHLRYVPDGLPCKCGQTGCLERYGSGSALDAAWGPSRSGRPAPVEVFEAAAAGDAFAVGVRDEFVAAVAAAVRVLVLTCDVGRVVIGGGVAQLGEPLLRALVTELDRQAASSPFLAAADLPSRVQLAPAGLPVGAVGAALVARGGR